MTDIRDRIERRFERLAAFICRRHWLVLAGVAVVAAGFASGVPLLTIDTSNEAFLHPDDPILTQYSAFKDQFGRDDIIVVAVEPKQLFTPDTLARIKALHDALAAGVPHLNDINSMVNARNTYGEGDVLVVDDLLRQWPETPEEMAALRARILANPLYINQLVSADASLTTIVIEIDAFSRAGSGAGEIDDALAGFDDEGPPALERTPLSDVENRETVEAVQAILDTYGSEDFRLYMAGTPTVTEALKRALQSDMGLFMLLAVAGIGLCLLVMFRRVVGVVLPLLVVALTLVSTLGLMGHAGVAVKVPTVILPSFLLAVGVGAAVHVLAIFFQQLGRSEDRQGAIIHALGHSGLAIVMTSLTTAAGLGSFAAAEVAPIADLGLFASLGVLISLGYTVVLLPALLVVIPVRPHRRPAEAGPSPMDRLMDRVAAFSTGNARAIVVVSVVLIAVFLTSAGQLRFTHDILSWLPEEWPVLQATRKIDRDLRGSVVLEVLLDTGRENGLYDRDILVGLDSLARELEGLDRDGLFVGKATSVADILKEIHQALNENRPEYHAIPENPALIPQEFLLFENSGSDDLQNVIDSQFRTARFTVRVPWRDTLEYVPLIRDIEQRFRATFGSDADFTMTGIMSLFGRTLDAAIRSMAKSYLIAFAVITLMMIVLIGNLKLGLASMLPNLTPIVVTVGLMWWAGIPLNMFTMLVGSIAIGLAVDDTIHFMHNFRRYFAETGDVRDAVGRTLHTAGRAMLVTSVVLAVGFYIFLFASLNNVIQFGLLTGTAIVLALLGNFLLAPALMVLLNPAAAGARTAPEYLEDVG
ncbi:MAG: efflux RND transporter permease subunit [Alphaproteobacteria bacterium]